MTTASPPAINALKLSGTLLFGLLMPVVFLFQAYAGMAALGKMINDSAGYPLIAQLQRLQPSLRSENDYRIAGQVLAESANQRAMINKQAMKVSAMYVGMATISLGIMLVMLGFKSDEELTINGHGVTVDFRKVSTGAAVFVIGACLTALAAVLPNAYATVSLPAYTYAAAASPASLPETSDEAACRRWNAPDSAGLITCLKEAQDAAKEK